MNCSTPV
ncbi:hypothetical protein [African swine fever virus]